MSSPFYRLSRPNYRFLIQLAIIAVILWYLSRIFSNIFSYIFISLVVSVILGPLVNYLNEVHVFRIRLPRTLAVLIAFAALILLMGVFVNLFVPLIANQIQILQEIQYDNLSEEIAVPLSHLEEQLNDLFSLNQPPGFLTEQLRSAAIKFVEEINFGGIINNIFSFAGSVLVTVLAVAFISFFLLVEKGLFRRTVINIIPNRYFEVVVTTLYKIEVLLSSYLRGVLIESLAVFAYLSILLSLFDIPYALTLASFAALVNFVPYVGPLSAHLFGLTIGLSTTAQLHPEAELWIVALKISGTFISAQVLDGGVLLPIIFAKSVKVHPLEIFLAIFAGATLAGWVGTLLAIPAYTVLRVSYTEFRKGYQQYRIFKKY